MSINLYSHFFGCYLRKYLVFRCSDSGTRTMVPCTSSSSTVSQSLCTCCCSALNSLHEVCRAGSLVLFRLLLRRLFLPPPQPPTQSCLYLFPQSLQCMVGLSLSFSANQNVNWIRVEMCLFCSHFYLHARPMLVNRTCSIYVELMSSSSMCYQIDF